MRGRLICPWHRVVDYHWPYSSQSSITLYIVAHSHRLGVNKPFKPNMERPSSQFTQFEVFYSTQSFLTLKDAHCLPQEDVDFLRHNRCFHLPSRSIQEEFIYQYFLYLHPYYPLINEKDFWDMYLDRDTASATKKTMPLLVFQAILFSASSVSLLNETTWLTDS